MTAAPARRTNAVLATLLATSITACGTSGGATSIEEAMAQEEANAAAAIQAKDSDSEVAAGITFSPSTVVAGQPVTVTIGFRAYPVVIGFPTAALAGPRFVRTRTFTLFTNPYLATTTIASVNARTSLPNPAASATAALTIVPGPLAGGALPSVASVQLGAASVTSGAPVSGIVTLTSAAPAGGLAVQAAFPNDQFMQNIALPPVVMVPAGATSASFTVETHLVTAGLNTLTDFVVANAFGGAFAGAALTVTR